MCGFVGIIGLENKKPIEMDLLLRMNRSILHRGPDSEGYLIYSVLKEKEIKKSFNGQLCENVSSYYTENRNVFLGFRRLSIIDLDPRANQPMSCVDEKIWIVFNGEIYNHGELREELLKKGYAFKTNHSDTETIINAYKEWGISCIQRLKGMFAFALYDTEKNITWLCRDRIGIKPLYYTIHNGRIYFASELKAILEEKTIAREINFESLYHYLSFLAVPAPKTLFKHINKLEAGYYLKIENEKVFPQEQYWDVFDNVSVNNNNEKSISEELLEQLDDSVAYRMASDVPIGVFLSGGVDSSTNVSLFSKYSSSKVNTFSIGYKNDNKIAYKNEFAYAQKVAKKFDTRHYQLELTQDDLINFLPTMIHHQDEPIADPVCVPVYYVSKLAKDNGVTVAQVGEGADELFCGYEGWVTLLHLQNSFDAVRFPRFVKTLGSKMFSLMNKKYGAEYIRRSANGEKVFWSGAESFTEINKKDMFNKNVAGKIESLYSWDVIEKYYNKFIVSAPEPSNLNWMSYIDLKLRLPELLLMRVDKMSMAVSLEARVPFLDHTFVEYAMGIPSMLKTKQNKTKYILKKAVENVIPHEIIYRKKQGFDTPIEGWFQDRLGSIAKEKINKFNSALEIFSHDYINKLFAVNKRREIRQIWTLLNLALWWEHFIN